jgi:hypothetical protein
MAWMIRTAALALALGLGAFLLMKEAPPALATANHLISVRGWEFHAILRAAPYATAFALTFVGLVMASLTYLDTKSASFWAWILGADIAAPLLILAVRWAALHLAAQLPT